MWSLRLVKFPIMSSDESNSPETQAKEPTDEDWAEDWGGQQVRPGESLKSESPEQEVPALNLPPRREHAAGKTASEKFRRIEPMRPIEEGRLERMAATLERVPYESANIEEKDWAQPVAFKYGWLLMTAGAVVVLIVTCLIALQQRTPDTPSADELGKGKQKPPGLIALETELKELYDRQDEARRVYADFASSQFVEDILPLIRNSRDLKDLIRRTGHQRLVDKDWRPRAGAAWKPYLIRGKPFACLTGELPDFSPFTAYFTLVGGVLLMDWKATTAYSTADFSELVQGRGDGSEVRGIMRPASLYTAVFPEGEYLCYQFESPDRREMLWCYVQSNSDLAKLLGNFFLNGQIVEEQVKVLPMTLKLKHGPKGSLPNQWLIEGVLHEDWIKM